MEDRLERKSRSYRAKAASAGEKLSAHSANFLLLFTEDDGRQEDEEEEVGTELDRVLHSIAELDL